MAIYRTGALGSLSGTIGYITTSKWKKLNVARNKPVKPTGPPSKMQQAHREKFGMVNSFLGGISKVIAIGYRPRKGSKIPINIAVKTFMEQSVTGAYPNYKLDYPNLRLTRSYAQIDFTTAPSIEAKAGNRIRISWALDPCPPIYTKPSDSAYIVLYSEDLKRFVVFTGIPRKSLGIEKTLPCMFIGQKVHCWMFFASVDEKLVSPTDYLGEVTLIR